MSSRHATSSLQPCCDFLTVAKQPQPIFNKVSFGGKKGPANHRVFLSISVSAAHSRKALCNTMSLYLTIFINYRVDKFASNTSMNLSSHLKGKKKSDVLATKVLTVLQRVLPFKVYCISQVFELIFLSVLSFPNILQHPSSLT